MDIEKIKVAKTVMEAEIQRAAESATEKFKTATGFSPVGFDIKMIEDYVIGDGCLGYVVGAVTADVEPPW